MIPLAFLLIPILNNIASAVIILNVNETIANGLPVYCQYCKCITNAGGIITDCYSTGLYRPPRNLLENTTELYLRKNLFFKVVYEQFQNLTKLRVLDLSANVITSVDVGAFKDLESLEELYLHENKFKSFVKALPAGAFEGLSNLKHLTLHGCITWSTAMYSKLPQTVFMDLTGLQSLTLDGVNEVIFGKEFKQLKYLTTLSMSGTKGQCAIEKLTEYSFTGLLNLVNLTMENCFIKSIDKYTFYPLNNLTYLDLSRNEELGFTGLGELYLQSTNLQILKINSIHSPNRAGSEILRGNMRNIENTGLVEMYMESNGLEYIDYGVFDKFPKTLRYLSMRDNRLTFGLYLYEVVFNTNLEIFDAGYQFPVIRPDRAYTKVYTGFINQDKRKKRNSDLKLKERIRRTFLETDNDIQVHMSKGGKVNYNEEHGLASGGKWNFQPTDNLETHTSLVVDDSVKNQIELWTIKHKTEDIFRPRRSAHEKGYTTIRKLICSGSMTGFMPVDFNDTENNITYMDISRNFIRYVKANAFLGLDKLHFLNLSENYIEHVDQKTFAGLVSLEILDLTNNLLGFILGIDQDGVFFSEVPNVVVLNLPMNRVSKLGKNVFNALHKVKTIDLSHNHLQDFQTNIHGLHNLQLLNLSYNLIQQINHKTRESLNELGKNNNISVDLSENNFMCNCDTLDFLHWINAAPITFANKHHYFCTLNNGTVRYFNSSNELINSLTEDCTSYFGIIMTCSVAGSFVASLAVFFVLYRQRWRLLYLYYMAKAKLDVNGDMNENDIRFQHDIFVSYGDGDRIFVIKEMLEQLEGKAGLRLNIRDRDFDIGEMVAVNISRAVRNSKRTFLLLSRHFLKNKWCNFEMNMARMEALHMKRKVIVLVFLDNIPNNFLPLEILDLLRDCPSIQYPKNDFDRQVFWEKCKELVNT